MVVGAVTWRETSEQEPLESPHSQQVPCRDTDFASDVISEDEPRLVHIVHSQQVSMSTLWRHQ